METGRLVLVGFGIGLGALAASAACGSSSAGTASSEDGGGSSSSGGTSSGGASSGGSSTSSSGGSPFPVGEGGFPFGGFDAGPINCYGASDCTEGGAGQACCFDMATYGASCQMGPCSSYTQCKTSSECPSNLTCVPSPLGGMVHYCAQGREGGAPTGDGGTGAATDGGAEAAGDGATD